MKRRLFETIRTSVLALICFLIASCSETEFLPDPEGERNPFQDTVTQTVQQLLAASTAKIYYQAWQRSSFKDSIEEKGNKFPFTIFAPDDAAMLAAGLSSLAVQQMPIAEVDSLLMFYTTAANVKVDELKGRTDNYVVRSMLERPGLYVKYFDNESSASHAYDHYFYKNYMAVNGENLLINGKSTGTVKYFPAKNGSLFILGKTVERPVKTRLQTLIEDGRFNMYLESLQLTDEMYLTKVADALEPIVGYRMEAEEIRRDWAYLRLYYDQVLSFIPTHYPSGPNIVISTLFAPTDDAFKKSGFQTVADIIRYNEEHGNVTFDENTYQISGGYPLDTLLNFHQDWGRFYAPIDPSFGIATNNATVFYSNVLNASLHDYLINIGGAAHPRYGYRMPLEFSTFNNRIQIKVSGSLYPAATAIETDINTLNGPIHVVDQLLIPQGFKLK